MKRLLLACVGIAGAIAVGVGDFNGDRRRVVLLEGRGDGTFRTPLLFGGPIRGFSLATHDLDGDEKLDLVAGSPDGRVVVLMNTTE